jgi:hypothetical protein
MRTVDAFAGKVLITKRSTCVKDLEDLFAEREQLLEQLRQTDAMISATQAYIRELDVRSGAAPADRRLRGACSIREMVLTIVEKSDGPLRATEIQARIDADYDRYVERTSLSSLLSKLRWAGKLAHDEKGWRMPVA